MTQSEEIWMRKHWPYMTNATCAVYLGKHPRTVIRMARKLGLSKSSDFIFETRKATLRKAIEANSVRLKGTYPINFQKWNNRNKNHLI